MQIPLVLSVKETAERAGVPVSFIRRLIADGSVHAVRSGKKYFVGWASVERFLAGEHTTETARAVEQF